MELQKPLPRIMSGAYSYANPASQGALICETCGFPFKAEPNSYYVAYSDRMMGWDNERFTKACELAGGGDQGWAYTLPALTDDALKEFAKVALNLDETPTHVRIVHHYNVSNGYSCPTVEAII